MLHRRGDRRAVLLADPNCERFGDDVAVADSVEVLVIDVIADPESDTDALCLADAVS